MSDATSNLGLTEHGCNAFNNSNYLPYISGDITEETQLDTADIVNGFIFERYTEAYGSIKDVSGNVANISDYLKNMLLMDQGGHSIELGFKFQLPDVNNTLNATLEYHNHHFLEVIKGTLKGASKNVTKSVLLLTEIVHMVKLDKYDNQQEQYQNCINKIKWTLFHYQVIYEKLNDATHIFDKAVTKNANKVFLHFACGLIFLMTIIAFFLLEKGIKTTGIYTVILRKLFIKTVAMILFVMPLITAFGNVFRLLIDHRNAPFRSGFHAVNKVLAMMTGELEYTDTFHPGDSESNTIDWVRQLTFTFFMVVMVILVCNFLISITMNDLNKIRPFAIAHQCKNILEDVLYNQESGRDIIQENIQNSFAIGEDDFEKVFDKRKRTKALHVCFQLVIEKNYYRPFKSTKYNTWFNRLMMFWHETHLESDRISLWVYDDARMDKLEIRNRNKMVPAGFIPIDTVKDLIEEDTTKYKNIKH